MVYDWTVYDFTKFDQKRVFVFTVLSHEPQIGKFDSTISIKSDR